MEVESSCDAVDIEHLSCEIKMGADFAFHGLEIHSTWAGVLFYYGFPGISMFIWFLKVVIERLNFYQICILMGPLVYGFSTFGLRTPIFWIVISAVIFAIQKRSEGGKGLSG